MKRVAVLILMPMLFIQFLAPDASTQSRKKVTIEGKLELRIEDSFDGNASETYFLNTGEERLELVFPDESHRRSAGTRVRMTGRMRNGKLNVERGEVLEAMSASPAVGEQRQLVMLFNFQDQPSNRPWTAAYIQDLVFNQVNQYYQQVSYGQAWVTGDLVGWFTIPVNSTDCSANRAQAAENGARALGYNPDNYSHKIYIYPTSSCGSSGGTTWVSTDSLGNVKTWMYINGTATQYILTHEFGHSLGFKHSNSLTCSGTTIGTNCSHVEYGDNYDVMGYYNNGVVNSYHRDLAQWLGPRIQTVTSNGTYTLTPTGLADSGLKAIRIPQAYDPVTNSTTYYYFEYRQPVGYDSFLSSYPGVTNGVLLHLGTIGTDANKLSLGSELLDCTPTSTGANQALPVGQSFNDPALPLTVTVLGANSSGATVSVQFTAPACNRANPTISFNPSVGQPAAPAVAEPFTVNVTNNDSSTCTSSTFSLQANLPSGWNASFANPTLTVAPGASASTTLSVSSASSTSNGSYPFAAAVTNTSSGNSGSATATFTVASSLGVTVSTDRSTYNRKQTVTMTGVVRANGSAVPGATVSFTMTRSNGTTISQSAVTGSNGSASTRFQLRKPDPTGMYQGRGASNMNGASGSATTNFSVQ